MVQQISRAEALPSETSCPLGLLFAAAENTGLLHALGMVRNVISQFSSVYSGLFPLPQCTVNTQDPALSCVIVVLGESSKKRTPKASMSVMPMNREQPLLCSHPVRGSHGLVLLLGLQTVTDKEEGAKPARGCLWGKAAALQVTSRSSLI